jgi:TatD DNase family protein
MLWIYIKANKFYNMANQKIVDTHTHIFVPEFSADRKEVMERAAQVCSALILPNIDEASISQIEALCSQWPELCFPALGLHPSSVPEQPAEILDRMEDLLNTRKWYGIGETGLDLYWDKTSLPQQIQSLNRHCEWALQFQLPLILHSRDAIQETIAVIRKYQNGHLTGVFHCFTGTLDEAREILDLGFYLGIGGVITYPKSDLKMVVADLDQSRILLETDSPWLPPVPYRGKRNESSYIRQVAEAVALAWHISTDEVAEITTLNANRLFNLR